MFKNIQLKNFDSLKVLKASNAAVEFPPHYHETYCISIIEKGAFVENDIVATQNSLLITNPYEVHKNSVLQDLRYSLKTFYVSKDVFDFATRTKEDMLFQKVIDDQNLFQQINDLSGQVFAENKNQKLAHTFEKDFLAFLLGLSGYKIRRSEIMAEEPDWILSVKEYITTHLSEKIELATLGKMAGLEKYQFIRSFKRYVGLTPFQFVMFRRVLKGKEMLKQNCSLIDAALESGFYDQSNFTNYFRLYTGDTPRGYQRGCNIFQESD